MLILARRVANRAEQNFQVAETVAGVARVVLGDSQPTRIAAAAVARVVIAVMVVPVAMLHSLV